MCTETFSVSVSTSFWERIIKISDETNSSPDMSVLSYIVDCLVSQLLWLEVIFNSLVLLPMLYFRKYYWLSVPSRDE